MLLRNVVLLSHCATTIKASDNHQKMNIIEKCHASLVKKQKCGWSHLLVTIITYVYLAHYFNNHKVKDDCCVRIVSLTS